MRVDCVTHMVEKDHTLVIPPGCEHAFKVVGEGNAQLMVFFPTLDLYSNGQTEYLEGSKPDSVKA